MILKIIFKGRNDRDLLLLAISEMINFCLIYLFLWRGHCLTAAALSFSQSVQGPPGNNNNNSDKLLTFSVGSPAATPFVVRRRGQRRRWRIIMRTEWGSCVVRGIRSELIIRSPLINDDSRGINKQEEFPPPQTDNNKKPSAATLSP